MFVCLIVIAFECLAETAFSNKLLYLITIANMILDNHLVITLVIIIAEIELIICIALDLWGVQTEVVDLRVVKDLKFFIVCEIIFEQFQCLLSRNRILNILNFNRRRRLIRI